MDAADAFDRQRRDVIDVALHNPLESIAHAKDIYAFQAGTDGRRADDAVQPWRRAAAAQDGELVVLVHEADIVIFRESCAQLWERRRQLRRFSWAATLEGDLLHGDSVRLEKATFGPVLRAARERKGVTLRQLAAETKISVELWAGLDESNLSRWPRQVRARSH